MSLHQCISTEILVIGSGGAALRAALAAQEQGAQVLVVSKGVAGRCGVTPTALTGYQAAFGHADSRDNPEVHFRDTMKNGCGLSDPVLARILAEESPSSVLYLEGLGVRFQKTPEGRFVQKRLDESQSYPRSVRIGDSLGLPIMTVLSATVQKRGIRMMSDILVTALLVHEGRVCGASALNMVTGELLLFRAGAVILATGGAASLYALSSNPPESTGDGYMLAYRAGAQLMDMEFFLFLGHAVLYPESARGVLYPFQYLLGLGARPLYNAEGRAFISDYTPEGVTNPSRDLYARAIHWEVMAGRGSEHGGAYFDPSSIPGDVLERELPSQTKFLRSLGVDMTRPLEVGVAGHFLCGGVRMNEWCATSVDGLFAVGEVAGGVHGGARIGGNALAELFVFGRRGGEAAAHFVRKQGICACMEEERRLFEQERERMERLLRKKDGPRPGELCRELQDAMWKHVSVIRSRSGLEQALSRIGALRSQLPLMRTAGSSRVFNLDLRAALELENMVELAGIIAEAALLREESRAGHFREDFPEQRREWDCNILVDKGAAGPSFSRKAVEPMERI